MKDISRIFMEISSKKGNKDADDAIIKEKNEKIKSFLDKYIEFLSVNLQAEFNRITCSPLDQLKTNEIGSKIKDIIEEHIARVLFLIEREESSISVVKEYFSTNLQNYYSRISGDENAKNALQEIFEMNLLHDFGQIVDRLCNFEVEIIDFFLKYLIVLNIHRRLSRRGIIPK